MSETIERFCDETHDYNNISSERRKMQRRVLSALEEVAGGDVRMATAEHVEILLSSQLQSGLEPTTLRKHLGAIRPFYRWMRKRGFVTADIVMDIDEVKPPRGAGNGNGTPNPYSRKEIARFYDELDEAYPWAHDGDRARAEEFWLPRWRRGQSPWARIQPYARRLQVNAIVALAMPGGIRRREIYNLGVEDVHPDNEYVVVHSAAKNADAVSRDRAVPWVTDGMNDALRDWLAFRDELAPGHGALWLSLWRSHRLKPLRFRQYEVTMREIGSGWEFHRMRHTAATEMLRGGYQLQEVQKILGHATLQQTLAYAKLVNTDIVAAATRHRGRLNGVFG